MSHLPTLFHLLNSYRHLPAYQLERRADIFFAIYLPAFLERRLGVPLEPIMIPELPLKRDLVVEPTSKNNSVKVDYCLIAGDRSRVYFVELKTDGKSRNAEQDAYLARARELGFRPLVEGMVDIMGATQDYGKYFHLADILAAYGYLKLPDELEERVFTTPRRGVKKAFAAIEVTELDAPVDIIYLQPTLPKNPGDETYILFPQFAEFVGQFPDEFSQLFAESLQVWASTPAGSVRPDS